MQNNSNVVDKSNQTINDQLNIHSCCKVEQVTSVWSMGCYCNRICSVGNCARLLHLSLTLFVFYVLLLAPDSDLHHAWKNLSSKFFLILSLLLLSTLSFLIASLIDPGFESFSKEAPLLYKLNEELIKSSIDEVPYEDDNSTSDSDSNQGTVAIRNGRPCITCKSIIQLRSRHCRVCARCVRRFDHHCPWLGNCVGVRNHRFFWLFLGLETALLIWGVFIAWSALHSSSDFLTWFRANILTFLSLVVVFVGSIATSMLFVFHTYLMISGQTTWEIASRFRISYLRDLDPPINPFDEGICLNIIHFLYIPESQHWDQVYERSVQKMKPSP